MIDSSEIGILLLKGNKKVLTNATMCDILNSLNIQNNYVSNILKHNKEPRKENFIVKANEKYYLFSASKNEIIAFDVTEEYKLQNELNEQNEKIAENNHKLIDNIKNIEKYEKEIEEGKVTILEDITDQIKDSEKKSDSKIYKRKIEF